jgi:hypothetical protein
MTDLTQTQTLFSTAAGMLMYACEGRGMYVDTPFRFTAPAIRKLDAAPLR